MPVSILQPAIMRSVAFFAIATLSFIHLACTTQGDKSENIKVNDAGVNIVYTDNGKGDTTLLFVHGWCINKGYWASQVNFFSRNYRVVTIDLPGFGNSGKNRSTWNAIAYGRDIDSVITQLHLKNVILVGHSMAGDIVVQAAVNLPKRVIGLVGIDNFKNAGHIETKEEKAGYNQAIDSLRQHFKKFASEYVSQDLFSGITPDSIKKRVLNDVAKADTTIATACMEEDGFDEIKQLKAVKRKLYLINSDVHPTDCTGLNINKIPYEVVYIHGTGHFPMIEAPREFNTALLKIIKQI